jgi:hypothetical protein
MFPEIEKYLPKNDGGANDHGDDGSNRQLLAGLPESEGIYRNSPIPPLTCMCAWHILKDYFVWKLTKGAYK